MLKLKSYQAKQSLPHVFECQGPHAPRWYLIDAQNQVVGRLATVIARALRGKHKPTYTKHADTGDFIVVLNAEQVVLTRNKWKTKLYRDHTGYVGGLKTKTAEEMLKKHPEEILRRAVWGMMNKSTLARRQMNKLKIYVGSEHPHAAQKPTLLPSGLIRRTVVGSVVHEKK